MTEPIHVLHVEDDRAFGELVATFLEREDDAITVTTAGSPDEAQETLHEEPVDCVVSDFDMPGENGLEFLKRVRETHERLPFILFTGKGSEEIASRAISTGVTDYLQKETGSEQYTLLANRVRNAVCQHRAERRTERGFQAMEFAREGIGLIGDDGRFRFVNETYGHITGYDPDELIGEHWSILYPETAGREVGEEIIRTVDAEGHWSGRTTFCRRDGSRTLVDHAVSRTDDGTVICLIQDMLELDGDGRRAASGRLLETAVDALDDLFYVLGPDGRLLRANDRLTDVTGYTRAEIDAMDPFDLLVEADRERGRRALEAVLEGDTGPVELRFRTKDGEQIPHEFRRRRLADSTGNVVGVVGIARDVSDQRRQERRLDRQAEQFEAAGSVLAHDVRGSLDTALGQIGRAMEEEDVPHLPSARDAIERADAHVDDLATVMDTGTPANDVEPVEIGEAFEAAAESVDFTDATLVVEDAATLEADGPSVKADPCAFARLAETLLRNAAQHADRDVTVTVGVTDDGFYVDDDGPGIDGSDRKSVFDPEAKRNGNGELGLVSVRQVALAHGWTVSVEENPEGGARFRFGDVTVRTTPRSTR